MSSDKIGIQSYRQLGRWVTLITIGSNSLGAFLVFFYLAFIVPLPETSGETTTNSWANTLPTVIGTILLLAVGGWMGRYRERFYPKWFDHLLAGASYKDVPEEARREVLQYPYWAALTSLLMWFIAGLTFGIFLTKSTLAFFGIFLVGGVFTTISTYLALEMLWRRVIPIYYPEGGVELARAFFVPILPRLLVIFFLVSIYPLGIVVLLSLDRARKILNAENPVFYMRNMVISEAFIFMIVTAASIILAILVTRSIVGPLTILQTAMSRVSENHLSGNVPVKSNDEMGFVTEHFNTMLDGLRRGELLRNLLNLYVSPEVAREAVEHGASLGGQLVECTVLFSDLRSFTALSETLPPEELIALLNRYMESMVDVIIKHGGMVNKFGGDSLLAVFGAPLNPLNQHASSAVRAALGMRDALAEFNKTQAKVNGPELQFGIAVATGKVVAGNVGGRERIEYTVIGDTVNLAARLQAMSNDLEHDILLNAESFARASTEMDLIAQKISNINVRGKVEPVTIYVL